MANATYKIAETVKVVETKVREPRITLELSLEEAQLLAVLTGTGIAWASGKAGILADNLYNTLTKLAGDNHYDAQGEYQGPYSASGDAIPLAYFYTTEELRKRKGGK